MVPLRLLLCLAFAGTIGCGPDPANQADPAASVTELLAQDEAFAQASARVGVMDGVAPMFAPGIMTPVPERGWVEGAEQAVAALRANPAYAGARLSWSPVRGGVSSDGLHGFTFGFMALHSPRGDSLPLKYLAYWVRDTTGWRLLAWRRRPRAAGDVSAARIPPFVPSAVTDGGRFNTLADLTASLAAAEQAFSDEAQKIGLGPAFVRWGRPDAINLGGPGVAGFVMGAEAIGAYVGGGDTSGTSPVAWSADRAVVAPSGDLGITFGMIRPHQAGSTPIPFFTVWARNGPTEPWRYIAE